MSHNLLLHFVADDVSGATAIEYALILALVCLAGLAGIALLGSSVENSLLGPVASKFANAVPQ